MRLGTEGGAPSAAGVEDAVPVDEQGVACGQPERDGVRGVGHESPELSVRPVPRRQLRVVEGQRLHQLVREPQVGEPSVGIPPHQRSPREPIAVHDVLAEPDLDPAQDLDRSRILLFEPVQHRPPVDHRALATHRVVHEHGQDLPTGRDGVLGVVVVRRHRLGGEGHVVPRRVDEDVEDEAERGVDQRDAQVPRQVDDRTRRRGRPDHHGDTVATEGLVERAPRPVVGDHLVVGEPTERVACTQSRAVYRPRHRRLVDPRPGLGVESGSVTVDPLAGRR